MAILWDNQPGAAGRYGFAVGSDIHTVDSASALIRTLSTMPDRRLVVIGPEVDLQGACEVAEAVRIDRPEVGVILLRRRLDVNVLAQALRAGIREVVPAEELTTLAAACRRSRDLTRRLVGHGGGGRDKDGQVVTVFSAKGGVGKTTFSANLGAYLASTGARTLVVDLDLAFGDVAISLQLLPSQTMTDVVAMSGHLDQQGLRSVVTTHESGLHVLCAPAEPGEADRIPGSLVGELLRVAKQQYDFVIIDTPPAFTEPVLSAFDGSDKLVLIATLDIPALKNLRLTLDTLDLLGSPREARVIVLNRSDAKVGLSAEDVVTSIKQEIAVLVPNSIDVPASVNRGVAIVLQEPRHPVSVALRRIADEHLRPPGGEAAGRSSRGSRGLRSPVWSRQRGGSR
jgi:pilus assembly protein CpaE